MVIIYRDRGVRVSRSIIVMNDDNIYKSRARSGQTRDRRKLWLIGGGGNGRGRVTAVFRVSPNGGVIWRVLCKTTSVAIHLYTHYTRQWRQNLFFENRCVWVYAAVAAPDGGSAIPVSANRFTDLRSRVRPLLLLAL